MKKAVVIYCSFTGNTEKVAKSIASGLSKAGCEVALTTVKEAENIDIYAYDLVCFGVPSINWYLPKPAADYLKGKFEQYKKDFGPVPPCAPSKPGKNALLFCTWSGPHTGIREAIPCVLAMQQYFEHFGFTVLDEWYVLSEFTGHEENSTMGRMGDIRGLPSAADLLRIEKQAENIVTRL
ncbi:MAG: flavodoxin domain-containing protein [Bacillota bacterium]|nr:flavodoxin domain-containing protein [Bacillota bacterium]